MTNTPAQLVVDDLSIRIPHAYGDVDVVSGVSFSVERGECVGLVGESGCGKTLTGLAIVGLLSRQMVVRGSVTWRGEEMIGGDRGRLRAIRGSEIGMVYQDALLSLNPSLRVARQLGQVVDRKGREAAIDEMLARVALHDAARIRRSYPFELSGGERQRVLIAMGLAQNPALLVADEPTTALDQTIEAQVMALIAGLRSESSLSLLLITHNIALVAAMASKIVVMYAGQVAEQGPTEEIIRRPRHPYTEGLISCIESLEARERPAGSIAGVVPPPLEFNKGCRFATRCERAAEDCLQRPPEGRAQGGGSLVACYHPLEVAPA